jgi:DNA-binding IclR family transcriptional regulator
MKTRTSNTTPEYPKGDLRRMLAVLGALSEAGSATIMQIAARTGLDKKTVSDLLTKAASQAAVGIEKTGSKYRIVTLGPVFQETGVNLALRGALNALS